MKLIKIDRLRGLSIGCLVMAVIALYAEFTAPNFEATFSIITLIVLTSAIEEVRTELRELREDIRKHHTSAN
jgi:hypothetical protein